MKERGGRLAEQTVWRNLLEWEVLCEVGDRADSEVVMLRPEDKIW
jgi:hypothetical protein